MNEETEGRELTKQAQGHEAGKGNPGLWVSFPMCSSDSTPFSPVFLPDGSYDYILFPWDFYMQEVTDILDSEHPSLFQEQSMYYDCWFSIGKPSNYNIKSS